MHHWVHSIVGVDSNRELKVIELRNYLLKPKARDAFIEYFEEHFLDSQNILGGYVLGQFRIKDENDRFFWIRAFENMQSRLAFLRAFYEQGEVWKKFGRSANEMMLDSDHVHLLKPLNDESFHSNELTKMKGIVVIQFCTAKDRQFEKLINILETDYVTTLKNKATLWKSEMAPNDFPRLPVIQDQDLLVIITAFQDESDYQSHLKESTELKPRISELLADESHLILFPTVNSLIGNKA
jgi:NIPSNAP